MNNNAENRLSNVIIGTAIRLHRQLGPGLLESVYEHILAHELKKQDYQVLQQQPVPLVHDDIKLEAGFRIDLMVENKVLVEIKSVEALAPVHFAQTLTYLKVSGLKLGLLINFTGTVLKNGLRRVVTNLYFGPSLFCVSREGR